MYMPGLVVVISSCSSLSSGSARSAMSRTAAVPRHDQPRVGLVNAEHAPAEQFAEDEQPGAGRATV